MPVGVFVSHAYFRFLYAYVSTCNPISLFKFFFLFICLSTCVFVFVIFSCFLAVFVDVSMRIFV